MKPLHQLPSMTTSDEATGSALSYLEHRQEWVLSQISKLQERVRTIGEKLGVGPADVGIIQQSTSGGVVQDVVIYCPPSAPPYALLALYKYVSRKIPCSYRVLVHSSAMREATPEIKEFFAGVQRAEKPRLTVTVIWKSDCRAPTMVVSPHNQTPVEGIANILRYICREFSLELYEGNGLETAAKIDSWLDMITGTLVHGGAKEKASVMRRLNSHLGSASFLAGGKLSLADIVGYVVVCHGGGLKPTANVKQWLRRCRDQLPELAAIPCNCLSDS